MLDLGLFVHQMIGKGKCRVWYMLMFFLLPTQLIYAQSPTPKDSTATAPIPKKMAANPALGMSKLGMFFLGKHYRKVWITPVTTPPLQYHQQGGGLTPLKMGGGKQTVSLRFKGENGVEYNLRSIKKYPKRALPEGFQETWINAVATDQIASAHPYGALAIPPMAEALDIYHTHPLLRYAPEDSLLGRFSERFAHMQALFEIRPDEDLSEYKRFGNTENAVGTPKMLEHLREDNDNTVDAEMYLKVRLFDMLIGDWDRHGDQWRWAEFEKEDKGNRFEPIPRDRDQVFVKFDGMLPWLFTRKWAVRKFKHFDYKITDIKGLNWQARHLDRRLLAQLSRQIWEETAQTIQQQLTDSVIAEALEQLPQEVRAISNPELCDKLISRREQLPTVAARYYEILAREVDIPGSDKHELFLVDQSKEQTVVEIFKTKKEGNVVKRIYRRVFYPEETKQIRLFGRDGRDQFQIQGTGSIELHVVGGEGDDAFLEKNQPRNRRAITYYDNPTEENSFFPTNTAQLYGKKVLGTEISSNQYDLYAFEYDYAGPRLRLSYNVDDGIYLGGGAFFKKHGFRKEPFASSHEILASVATNTGAFDFQHESHFYSLLAKDVDLHISSQVYGPSYVFNYFGAGNETNRGENDIAFHRVRMNELSVEALLGYSPLEGFSIGLGPFFQYNRVKPRENTIVPPTPSSDVEGLFIGEEAYFGGLRLKSSVDAVKGGNASPNGIRWENRLAAFQEMSSARNRFFRLSSEFSGYFTPNWPVRLTLASRTGMQAQFGDYYFYQAAFLGGRENLRGYRRTRFAGDASFYQNTELRLHLFRLKNFLLKGDVGVIGFHDIGRVWLENEVSDTWHQGYGPGVFLHLYDNFTFSSTVGFSKEGHVFNVNYGFFF